MAIVRNFSYQKDDDTGIIGLLPTWFDNASPTSGRGVAHDMLEHFKTQSSAVEGELEAFGAALALRWESGAAAAPWSLEGASDIMAGDVYSVIEDLIRDRLPLPAPKNSYAMPDNEWADGQLVQGVAKGFKIAEKDADLDEYAADLANVFSSQMQATFVAWIRKGYRRAIKRFRNVDLYSLGIDFFKEVTKTVDNLINSDHLALGDAVRISLRPDTHRIEIKVNGRDARDYGYI